MEYAELNVYNLQGGDTFTNKHIKKEGETLDDLSIQLNPTPNILKIDIHGSEGFMLEGSRDFLKNKVKK